MKLKRILAMPFTVVADIATLGNMGERSFTQQLFDAERREQQEAQAERFIQWVLDDPSRIRRLAEDDDDPENPYSCR